MPGKNDEMEREELLTDGENSSDNGIVKNPAANTVPMDHPLLEIGVASTCSQNPVRKDTTLESHRRQRITNIAKAGLVPQFKSLCHTAKSYLKVEEKTNSFYEQNANGKAQEQISSYLCHGKQVTDLHYCFKTDQAVIAQAKSVEEVISCLVALDLVREKRVDLPAPTDAFHGPVALMSGLRAALRSKDVTFEFGLNPMLYSTIQHYWKDSVRDALIEGIAAAASHATSDGAAQQLTEVVNSLLSALPAVWAQEKSNLAHRILEKFDN
ncbi:uncharacterized protein LOC117642914 [Thrips palmi]|uniref:Uncharacterized protein LOC117642914 n=1 Tax=Thrips palmi TaxID=161013 RepID=A0A6P8YL00_THRPL|nr:uncharacterized protein LOC117642914 [Thrips palmi]